MVGIPPRRYWRASIGLALLLCLLPAIGWADIDRIKLGVGGMMCPI
jgi:hypothetical protein